MLSMLTSQSEFEKYYLVVQYRKFYQTLQMQVHHRHLGHIVTSDALNFVVNTVLHYHCVYYEI